MCSVDCSRSNNNADMNHKRVLEPTMSMSLFKSPEYAQEVCQTACALHSLTARSCSEHCSKALASGRSGAGWTNMVTLLCHERTSNTWSAFVHSGQQRLLPGSPCSEGPLVLKQQLSQEVCKITLKSWRSKAAQGSSQQPWSLASQLHLPDPLQQHHYGASMLPAQGLPPQDQVSNTALCCDCLFLNHQLCASSFGCLASGHVSPPMVTWPTSANQMMPSLMQVTRCYQARSPLLT